MKIYNSYLIGNNNQLSGSLGNISQSAFTGSLFGTSSWSGYSSTSSYSLTASYALNGGGGAAFPFTGSAEITGSLNVTGSLTVSGSQINLTTDAFGVIQSNTLYLISADSSVGVGINRVDGNTVADFESTVLYDSSAVSSIDWTNRQLYDSSGVTAVVDWNQNILSDNTAGAASVDWEQRQLLKSDGSTIALDWENGILTGSLYGTASWAENVTSASYSTTASFLLGSVESASYASTASFIATASWAENAITASYVLNSISSSFANTASYVLQVVSSSYSSNSDLLDGKDSTIFAVTGSNLFIGTQEISGSIQLNPTIDPGSSNTTSSFFFVTSSGDNTEYNLHYRNNGALWETHWLEERTDTGLVWGGVLTFTNTTMSITPGAGLIVNHNASTGSHGDTVPTYVQFGPITASATYITSSQITYLLIDSNGSLIQQTSPFTPQQYNEAFPLGYIFCLTTSSISSYADARVTTYGQDEQQSQFIRAFGPLKVSGYDITAQSGSLKISIASGRSYRAGGFYTQNPDNPSLYDSSTVNTGSLVRVYRDPNVVGGFKATLNGLVPFTDIDPTMWDDGSGTLQAVGSSEWTIQRVFQGVVNNISYVYYGQNTYDSLNAAVQSITTEAFEESPTSIIALPFIGYVITRGNTTNLGDTTNNKIINSGLFRNTAGSSGGGGVATTNLNDLSDVNIVSPNTGQALVYNAGLWENNTPLNSTSASYADTASFVNTAQTASYIAGANVDGNISGDANNITAYTINQNLSTTSNVTFTGVTASLFGTSSWSNNAQTASYVLQAVSSSNANTASFALSGNGTFSGSFSGSFQGNFTGDGSALTGVVASAVPGGQNTSVQFNDNGSTSGSANFTFDKTTNKVSVTGSVHATAFSNTTKVSGSSAAAGDYITTQYLTGDVTNNTATLATAMTTTNIGTGLYQFKYVIRYQSTAVGTGIGFAVESSGTANYFVSSFWFVSTGATAATGVADQIAATLAGQMVEGKSERVKGTSTSTTTGVDTANADMLAVMEGLIDLSSSGDLVLEFRSEAAVQVTVKAGTCLILTKMS